MVRDTELEELLKKLVDAGNEARKATSDAHAARKDLVAEVKKHREQIASDIAKEITAQIGRLVEETRLAMRAAVDAEIGRLAQEWRAKLGVD